MCSVVLYFLLSEPQAAIKVQTAPPEHSKKEKKRATERDEGLERA